MILLVVHLDFLYITCHNLVFSYFYILCSFSKVCFIEGYGNHFHFLFCMHGIVSDALPPGGLDKRAGQIGKEGDRVPRGPVVVSRQGNLHQLKKHDAQNTQLCHKIRNIIILNHGDTFAVKF